MTIPVRRSNSASATKNRSKKTASVSPTAKIQSISLKKSPKKKMPRPPTAGKRKEDGAGDCSDVNTERVAEGHLDAVKAIDVGVPLHRPSRRRCGGRDDRSGACECTSLTSTSRLQADEREAKNHGMCEHHLVPAVSHHQEVAS